jgi:NTP pyrophosphatase (non-canonical NTP hydrolase)
MDIKDMFQEIESFHIELGHSREFDTMEQRMQSMRNGALAVMMELAELVDSTPWKPWRKIEDQPFDKDNATREIVDIAFFLVQICEQLFISPQELEDKFEQVIANNYKRLENGYSLKGGDASDIVSSM